jgi:excisionase family DNA binding protein
MTERFLTKKEIARQLSVTTRTVDKWRRNGVIPFVKLSGTVRFSPQLLQNIADSVSTIVQPIISDDRERL